MSKEALKLALEALEYAAEQVFCENDDDLIGRAIPAIREALAEQPAQPSKPWVGLDQHDIDVLFLNKDGVRFARYIEAKLREKNQ